MDSLLGTASLWLALAVLSALLASSLRLSIALVEICVGTIAAAVCHAMAIGDVLSSNAEWVRFLASVGAILLTFLAGAELDPDVLKTKLSEVTAVGLIGFFAPFLGCAAIAYYVVGWDVQASWLTGIALSTTSMAVVYAVMLETGFNRTEYGKGILGACFINDLGTVIALGLLFAPFTFKTVVFLAGLLASLAVLPRLTAFLTKHYAYRTAAIR
ncbi:MAG TPA: cation:proton antiporter, partial [Nitrospirales bacterium]|nr:cation:proton antiporter [Nitrospirales bacterium]